MTGVFKKLNLKDEKEIVVINSPKSFEPELAVLPDVSVVREVESVRGVVFSLAFVIKQDELNSIATKIAAKATGDAILWFAYPKGTSRKYKCEFNRDSGWDVLGAAGFEGVRQVAIDEDWSAIRFRRARFIRSMKRNPTMALSVEGKKRASKK